MSEKVYKFVWDCGYGCIEGVFVATPEQVMSLIGQDADFGENLGKHSEVTGTIEPDDITLISEDPVVVEFIRANPFGYSPLDYAGPSCEQCGEKVQVYKPTFWCHTCEERLCRYCSEERHKGCLPIVTYEKRGEAL